MNDPQRTACLAKGCINNQYQLAIARQWASSMVTSLAMLHVRQEIISKDIDAKFQMES